MPTNFQISRRAILAGAAGVALAGFAKAPGTTPTPGWQTTYGAQPTRQPSSAAPTTSGPPPKPTAPVPLTSIHSPHGLPEMWPNEPLEIVVQHGTVAAVTVTDTATGEQFPGTMDGTWWRPDRGALYLNSNYQIEVTANDANGDPHVTTAQATTVSPGMVVEVDFRFAGEDIGNGLPIWVRFDLPINADQRAAIERTASITTSPPQEGSGAGSTRTRCGGVPRSTGSRAARPTSR